MKIRVTDIPAHGLKVNETMSLENLNARMQEGQDKDILFLQAPAVELTVFKTPNGAHTRGTLRSRYKQSCSRCLDPLERDIEVEVSFVLQHVGLRESSGMNKNKERELEDIGVVYFEGEHVDLEDALQETLILALSRFWHPPLKADGSCTVCGLKFEDKFSTDEAGGLSLGDLLRKSGLKNRQN